VAIGGERQRCDAKRMGVCGVRVCVQVALYFAYLGVGYHGMQRNPGVVSIEDVLEQAIFEAGGISEDNRGDFSKVAVLYPPPPAPFRGRTRLAAMHTRPARCRKEAPLTCLYARAISAVEISRELPSAGLSPGRCALVCTLGTSRLSRRGRACSRALQVNWTRAARTDKGVSAVGQLVALKCIVDPPGLVDRINAALPAAFRCFGFTRVTNGFNAKNLCDKRR
jgi:hypothetical protein